MIESIEKLRTSARNMAKGRNLEKHEDCNLLLIIADEIEAEIAERYMLLPVDADGVPIRVGDVMVDYKTPRNVVAVAPDSFMMSGYEIDSFYRPGLAKNHRHVKPRTIEDVLADFASKQHGITKEENDALIAECAAEIRELMEVRDD